MKTLRHKTDQPLFRDEYSIATVSYTHLVVLGKASLAVTLKFRNIGVQPDGFAQIKLPAEFINPSKNFVRAGICGGVLINIVLLHVIGLPDSSP